MATRGPSGEGKTLGEGWDSKVDRAARLGVIVTEDKICWYRETYFTPFRKEYMRLEGFDYDVHPAVETRDGKKKWCMAPYRGSTVYVHRADGKPAIIYPDGRMVWVVGGIKQQTLENGVYTKMNDPLRNTSKPAVLRPDGTFVWGFWNSEGVFMKHCENGPAVVKPDGTCKWYYVGQHHKTEHVDDTSKYIEDHGFILL